MKSIIRELKKSVCLIVSLLLTMLIVVLKILCSVPNILMNGFSMIRIRVDKIYYSLRYDTKQGD